MTLQTEMAALFRRDLGRLGQEIEAFPNDGALWETVPGVTNAAGSLALHLEGNLREFVGRRLGGLDYVRDRELEFSCRGMTQVELGLRVEALRRDIPAVIEGLSLEQMEAQFPVIVLERATSAREFLIHLLGHLSWHLGQMDYLRRVLGGDGALKMIGL